MKKARVAIICFFVGSVLGALGSGLFLNFFAERERTSYREVRIRLEEMEALNSALQENNNSLTAANNGMNNNIEISGGSEYFSETIVEEAEMEEFVIEGAPAWNLRLVNEDNPFPDEHTPELVELMPGYKVDRRIVDSARAMFEDAEAEGLDLHLISAHRNYEEQKEIFDETLEDWHRSGLGWFDAFVETRKSVALPGHSEHASGLALDIISPTYDMMDERQRETPEIQWLQANSWRYGFILRYPQDKSHITGIIYEPWHYRYVGREAAAMIFERGITLEEFIGGE